jgi:methylmalonyl-CoA/ethylmalonyl-CoA epimerase
LTFIIFWLFKKPKICINLKEKELRMKPTHIEHIGIAVKNLQEAIKYYENVLGLECYAVEEVADQKVKTAFFQVGQTKIELLEATADDSPVAKFIEKKGEGIHHIAFAMPDVNNALKEAEANNIQLIDKKARKGAEGMQIGFLHPKSTFGVLTEFCGKN